MAQIDAKRCFDREYELLLPWSLTAPAGWVACGILALDVAGLLLTGHGADWKGRQLPKQEVTFPQSHRDILSALLNSLSHDGGVSSGVWEEMEGDNV